MVVDVVVGTVVDGAIVVVVVVVVVVEALTIAFPKLEMVGTRNFARVR